MAKTVLLIGATGLVGADIYQTLIKSEKCNVIATSRENRPSDQRLPWIEFDLYQPLDSLIPALKKSDVVIINAAAKAIGHSIDDFCELQKVNIDFVTCLAKLISEIGGKKVIFISSLSLLRRPLESIITETDECAPTLPYSISKYWAEKALFSIDGVNNCSVYIFRISSPIPSDFKRMGDTVVKKWIESAKVKNPFSIHGSGKRTQDFIFAGDIGTACLNVFDAKQSGIYNIATGQPLSMTQLAELIKRQLPGAVFNYVEASEPQIEKWNISIEKAKTNLGFLPTHTSEEAILALLRSCL